MEKKRGNVIELRTTRALAVKKALEIVMDEVEEEVYELVFPSDEALLPAKEVGAVVGGVQSLLEALANNGPQVLAHPEDDLVATYRWATEVAASAIALAVDVEVKPSKKSHKK